MAKYKIIGTRSVAGKQPGATVELDMPDANIAALVAGGHIEPVKTAAKAKTKAKEDAPVVDAAPVDTDTDYDPREG